MKIYYSDSLESSILTKENINTNDDYLSNQYFNKFPYDYDQFSKQIKFLNHLAGNILIILIYINLKSIIILIIIIIKRKELVK